MRLDVERHRLGGTSRHAPRLADAAELAHGAPGEPPSELAGGLAHGLPVDRSMQRVDEMRRLVGEALVARGDVDEVRALLQTLRPAGLSGDAATEWGRLDVMSDWPDSWLVAVIRRDPVHAPALDVLAQRHWGALYSRCHLLALDAEHAADMAQDVWVRLLRARHRLDPSGNFGAYLATIATNLWRDARRHAHRAGGLSERRIASLDAAAAGVAGNPATLGDLLPDPATLGAEEQALLQVELDRALASLSPQMRGVLLARYVDGESCAEIGARYGRTEQAVTSWLRQAIRDMQHFIGIPDATASKGRAS